MPKWYEINSLKQYEIIPEEPINTNELYFFIYTTNFN